MAQPVRRDVHLDARPIGGLADDAPDLDTRLVAALAALEDRIVVVGAAPQLRELAPRVGDSSTCRVFSPLAMW